MAKKLFVTLFVGVSLAALGCGAAGGKGAAEDNQPQIQVDPSEVQFSMPTLSVGDTGAVDIVVTNGGTKALTISSVELVYTIPAGATEPEPAIRLDAAELPELPVAVGLPGSGENEAQVISLLFTRYDDEIDRTAELRIVSDDPDNKTLVIPISTTRPAPLLRVVPEALDLGQVSLDQTTEKEATLRNSGTGNLEITGFLFKSNNPNFALTFEAQVYTPSDLQVELATGLTLKPDQATFLKVSYTAKESTPADAQIVIFSNDPKAPTGTVIQVTANQEGACVEVVPAEVDFGGKVPPNQYLLPVELKNCSSSKVLNIAKIDFENGIDRCEGPFCVQIPAELGSGDFNATSPLVVNAGDSIIVNVIYAPSGESEVDENGQPVRDRANLIIESNAFTATTQVPVSGFGIPDDCPVAVIHIEEGEEVIPQTVLHLHGENSYSNAGNINKYEWSVEQPALSASKFVPTPSYPSPTFEANVAGKYVFKLNVWDEYGRKSCFSAEAVVFVVPDEAIHVELLWTSPGDPNPDDEGPTAGTDLDLHFAHPNASQSDLDGDGNKDPWFDPTWDTFWFYPLQNWGSISSNDDNPSLDRDDVDGNGPENINLDVPEDAKTYAFGVNYWDDHGFGTAFATVRVYIYAQLVFEVKDVVMYDHDMWWCGSIDWPSGQVKSKMSANGGYWLTHDYHHPLFYQP
jgi:hypothetical protein